MKITPFKIEKLINNTWVVLYPTLLQVNNKNYLIDCGYEETFEEFVAELQKLGVSVKDLDAVIISHDDIDHIGALYLFKNLNKNLKIYCSKVEEPSVSGRIKSERLIQAENSLPHLPEEHKEWAKKFIQQLKEIKRVEVDLTVGDNDKIHQEVIVINTPGHTKGHISLYVPNEKTVITNDAVVIEEGTLDIANPAFTLDINEAIISIEKIRDLQPDKLICYHGGEVKDNVNERLQELILKYKNQIQQHISLDIAGGTGEK